MGLERGRDLWDGGHFKQAVNAAAAAVEEQTQLKLDWGDLGGADLYTQAFKTDKIGEKPADRRLRFPHLDELTEDGKRNQSWISARMRERCTSAADAPKASET